VEVEVDLKAVLLLGAPALHSSVAVARKEGEVNGLC
jgi:hypothetical protein